MSSTKERLKRTGLDSTEFVLARQGLSGKDLWMFDLLCQQLGTYNREGFYLSRIGYGIELMPPFPRNGLVTFLGVLAPQFPVDHIGNLQANFAKSQTVSFPTIGLTEPVRTRYPNLAVSSVVAKLDPLYVVDIVFAPKGVLENSRLPVGKQGWSLPGSLR